jgi:NAD(P)-dependent dehydrogenase (short-subunit alcohol dehydrogenase family)
MGSAVPYLFAREGANVVLSGRRLQPLEELAARIQPHLGSSAGQLASATGDATTGPGCDALVKATVETFGRLDIVYCNVGDAQQGRRPIEEIDDDLWRFLVDVNLTSNFLPVRAALPQLKATKGTAILVAAAHGVWKVNSPAYAATKSGLLGMTQNLARRLHSDGIRVNCICPGSIGPSKGEGDFTEPSPDLVSGSNSMDVAYAALYFASAESAWVTGQFIEIDGGAGLLA